MWRTILAALVGYIIWWAIGIGGFLALRNFWHDYAVAEPTLALTLSMRLARLLVGVACGLGAGIAINCGRSSRSGTTCSSC
jgi:hypothetical protein